MVLLGQFHGRGHGHKTLKSPGGVVGFVDMCANRSTNRFGVTNNAFSHPFLCKLIKKAISIQGLRTYCLNGNV
jgi:hypothetical protein